MNFPISCDSRKNGRFLGDIFVSISTGFSGVCKFRIVFTLSTMQLYQLLLIADACLCRRIALTGIVRSVTITIELVHLRHTLIDVVTH